MKHMKLLVVFLSFVCVTLAIVLLYRRTNVLLSHYENVTRDVNSIKNFLTKNVKPPTRQAVNGSRPIIVPSVSPPKREVLERQVNTEPLDKIKHTQHNIEELRASIEVMEDMISSSSGYSSEDADDESNEQAVEQVVQNLQNETLESYDLEEADGENSELEDLLNSDSVKSASDAIENASNVSNPQESNELTTQSIAEEVTVDIILNTYTKKTLENLCGHHYLSKSGTKRILIERLIGNGYKFNKKSVTSPEAVVSN